MRTTLITVFGIPVAANQNLMPTHVKEIAEARRRVPECATAPCATGIGFLSTRFVNTSTP
ncbi:MAG: hypothetical protein ACLQJR_08610 [Stellaceae bacterium]